MKKKVDPRFELVLTKDNGKFDKYKSFDSGYDMYMWARQFRPNWKFTEKDSVKDGSL